jgi:hypothetical protein
MLDHCQSLLALGNAGAVDEFSNCRGQRPRLQHRWQREFFDHLLRSEESYDQKWNYVRENPVRAPLTQSADEWPWAGEIDQLLL